MASLRSRPDPAARSGDTASRRMGTYVEPAREDFPSSLSQRARKETEMQRSQFQGPPQTKAPGRIPQASALSGRRPSLPGQGERPTLLHQPQSWNSAGSASSAGSSSSRLPPVASKATRNVIRRKDSIISKNLRNREEARHDSNRSSSSSSIPRSQNSLDSAPGVQFDRGLTESPMEIRVAQRVELPLSTPHTVTIYPELDRYREVDLPKSNVAVAEVPFRIATQDLPPPTPLFSGTSSQLSAASGTPSTRFSESPGPSPYSRDTTPTSFSSQSPGLVAPLRMPASRVKQASPAFTRPPVTRRRAGSVPNEVDAISADPLGLAAVRESLTSSSSNSTVRDGDKKQKDKKKKKALEPLPPSPPPRKSSQKFTKGRDEDESPSKPAREPSRPLMTSPPPPNPVTSPSRPQKALSPRPAPPRRPSRDGTPDLQSQLGLPLPVVHSNLSTTSLSERRQSTGPPPSALTRSITPSSLPDNYQPQSRLPIGREPAVSAGAKAQEETRAPVQAGTGRTTRTPSPSVSTFKTRFPLFGRRTKTAPEVPQVEKKEKPVRKGPAAGTGHEGYGRLGHARRRSSGASNVLRGLPGTMSSQESLSNLPQDPFLKERMAPVVISGGAVIENHNTSADLGRTDSNQSLSLPQLRSDSKNSSQVSLSSRDIPRHTLWPSAFPRDSGQAPPSSVGSRRPSDSSDSEALAMRSTLAFRRSMQRLKSSDQQQMKLPKPIKTRTRDVVSPSMSSIDASVMSDDSVFDGPSEMIRGRKEPENAETGPKKLTKRARSPKKWNFFSRSQSQPATAPRKQDASKTVAATVKPVQSKPVAFYTMMDSSEQEEGDAPDIQEVLREARTTAEPAPPAPAPPAPAAQAPVPAPTARARRASVTKPAGPKTPVGSPKSPASSRLPASIGQRITSPVAPTAPIPAVEPSKPQAPPAIAEPSAVSSAAAPRQPSGRPSRLPQVGRIPKVVSARPEQTSPKSFSRPFNRVSMQLLSPSPAISDANSVAKGPTPPKPSTPELTHDESTVTSGTNPSTSQYRLSAEFSPDLERAREFLSFSPGKNSMSTVTTTSSSSGILSFAEITAVVPSPRAPLAEDEIWDEYDDLLGEDAVRIRPSMRSSMGKPFYLEGYAKKLQKQIEPPQESPTINDTPHPVQSLQDVVMKGLRPVTSSLYSVEPSDKANEIPPAESVPLTPFSVSEFVTGYGDRNNGTPERKPEPAKTPVKSPQKLAEKIPEKLVEKIEKTEKPTRASDSSRSSQGSEDSSPLSQVNLRVGSMTVSKWLTFGHVLFSPARDDLLPAVGSLKRHSILVMDGLGNDDWSFYAAETYPAATFFNLSPRAPLPVDHQNSTSFPLSPPNHHQIQYMSHIEKFPFGPQSFTSVVYRFPAAGPESHYRNIISEARRVLKPGGFIELSILDVDLNNMGIRGRRAVRRLKERIHSRAPDTSLGSTADLVLRLLGRKGFVDIKTCRVGVPVASSVTKTSGSEGQSAKSSGSETTKTRGPAKARKEERTLAEMMSDESAVADESITKMVAKVGRWWYSRCYENAAAVPDSARTGPNSGIWNDKALLSECEEWGTSLKLMVCHARVPESRGRVASI